jgi:predicted RNA-binding Zn-ribbon protein involved in translation (DUF1610 family)
VTDDDQPQDETQQEPARQKVTCATCGRTVDVEEITTLRGKFYCPNCADAAISACLAPTFRQLYDVRSVRWLVVGCAILFFAFIAGATLVMIFTYMRFDTEIACRNRLHGHLYEAILLYARANNVYPPANNDLRPLYDKKYTTNFHLFVCPGTGNVVTTIHHLKDEDTSPEGPGMSYFYQGGYSFWSKEGDEKRPLVWDQGTANHRGRGVNVVYKDGHHEWAETPPQLHPPGEPIAPSPE